MASDGLTVCVQPRNRPVGQAVRLPLRELGLMPTFAVGLSPGRVMLTTYIWYSDGYSAGHPPL